MADKLYSFHGGLEVDGRKELSLNSPLKTLPLPPKFVVSMAQHAGKTASPVVTVGDKVGLGQLIGAAATELSANIHAPASGTVTEIKPAQAMHPSGLTALSVVIVPDGEDKVYINDYKSSTAEEILQTIHAAGIVGLGGAGFPSGIKTLAGMSSKISTLIINGAECEPYISCDDRLMRDKPAEIIRGIEILAQLIKPERILLVVEDNKAEAIERLRSELGTMLIKLVVIPTIYPSGGERQLAKILLDLDLDSNKRSYEAGVLCFNVATCFAVHDAVDNKKPLTERIVTIVGEGLQANGNYLVRVGTELSFIQDTLNIPPASPVICGGPFMGYEIGNPETPLSKTTNCLLINKFKAHKTPVNCIKCGKCAEVCPAELLPQELYLYSKACDYAKAVEYKLFDCIECGCCNYVCPSYIPLVVYYQNSKAVIRQNARKKEKSQTARMRHEKREERLARIKRERKEKTLKQRASLKQETDKKELIKKARERLKS